MTISPTIIEGLSFAYPNFPVFSDFYFSSQAKVVVLKGPSGCGKSTLLKLLTRFLLPDQVSEFQIKGDCCLLLQEDSLLPWLSGMENISTILKISPERITEHPMFDLVKSFVRKNAYEMSYGQRRMVEIFRAVLRRPEILCLDEPLNFLDPVSRRNVIGFLKSRELDDTQIFLATHHTDEVNDLVSETFMFNGNFPVHHLEKE